MPTEAQKKAIEKYHSKLERIVIRVPMGEKNKISDHAEKKGLSVNSYIVGLIKKDIEQG